MADPDRPSSADSRTGESADYREPASRQIPAADVLSRSTHVLGIGGRDIAFTATCGTVVLHEEREKDGVHEGAKPRATLFHVAYVADGGDAARPVVFCFNGGPGSSSVWLHLGVLGPWRVALDDMGRATAPAGAPVPNVFSLLDVADLVFIDPVGTGYSRMVSGEKTKEFHDIGRDVEAVGEFIRLWCSREKRWASPKFIAGESYGTTRAAVLAHHLQDRHGMFVDGLMLISCALEFSTFVDQPGALNDLPYPLYLPGYAATAWYHRRLAPDLQALPLRTLVDEVERYAADTYLRALFAGRTLPVAARAEVAAQVARYTGLTADYVARSDLRIRDDRFFKELLRDQGLTIGRFDTRFTGRDRDAAGETIEEDPSYTRVAPPFAAGINYLLRATLNYETDAAYRVIAPLWKDWSWGDYKNRHVSVTDALRRTMADNPHLRVYVASAYYDLATPHFATDYALRHLALDEADAARRVQVRYFEAGHMMYIHRPCLEAMAGQLRAFVAARAATSAH